METRPPEEERKLVTVLFADLVGSTELAGGRDPEHTRAVLDRFYDAMADEIGAAGGTIEKFAGDAVMAAFGAPASYEDHAERGLSAALAMRARLDELFGTDLGLRTGVNTGEVVIGRARVGSSFASGDAVNVAARLEQAAAPGEILVGERTAAAGRGAFEFGDAFTIEAKGKPEGVVCRRLLGRLAHARAGGVPGLRRTFVGRANELEALRMAYRDARENRRPQLVAAVGEAGVGKTRLVRELLEELGGLRLEGRCPSYGRGNTYWPLAEILRQQLGLSESDSPATVLERLRGREILGLTLGLDVAGELHPRIARTRLHEAWRELVEELAAVRPLVLLLEDLHWAEQPLLELVEHLSRSVGGPLLLLCTARPELLERRPEWATRTVPLNPLSRRDAEQIVDGLAQGLPTSLRDLVVARAEGNPFFIEEFLGMLIDQGLLERSDGSWSAHELPPDFAVPDSIQSVLAARIDLLAGEQKAALQGGSVIGRRFWASPLRVLLEGDDPKLDALEERDLIRRRATSSLPGELEYLFKHALTRDVAYGTLTRARRARLHAAFADWLERRGQGRDEHAPLLAHHYAQAVDPEFADLAWPGDDATLERLRERAVAWLRRAAELAVARYAVDEALALLDRALALLPDREARIEILLKKGAAHTARYDVEGFRDSMEAVLSLDPERSVAAHTYAQLAYYGIGRPYMWKQPPGELGTWWLAKALELAAPGSEARGYALLARALSEPRTGVEAAVEALAIGEALAHQRLVLYASEARALAATEARRYEEAREWADRALAATRGLSDPGVIGHQYWNAGFVYLRAGHTVGVRRFAEVYDRLARSLTPHEEVHVVALYALLESVLGRWDALADLARRAEAATAANEDFPCQFNWRTLLVCALSFAQLDSGPEARRLEEQGRRLAVVAGPPEREPALLRLALLRGDLDDAQRILERLPTAGDAFGLDAPAARLDALAALGETERVEEEAAPFLERPSYVHPFALRALGTTRGDASLLERAAARFEAMGLAWRAQETRALQ